MGGVTWYQPLQDFDWLFIMAGNACLRRLYCKCPAKVFVFVYANCCTNSYYNLNPCGIFEKMTPSPGLGTIKINGDRKFLEFKAGVHQKCVKMVCFHDQAVPPP